MRKLISLVLVFLSLALGSLACNLPGQPDAQDLGLSVEQTATARAAGDIVAEGPSLDAARATATAQAQAFAAEQTAQAAQNLEAGDATATAIAPILAELATYGVNPADGAVAWIHPPIHLEIEGYLQSDYTNNFIGTVAHNFVVSSDVTWNTFTGIAGCGFVLRSDGNEEALNQYLVIASRGGTGTILFITQANGELVEQQNINAGVNDPNFEWQNDTTNRLTVVAQDQTFSIYTNGTKLGEITASEYERGFVAMAALSESGRTACDFNNTWMWLANN